MFRHRTAAAVALAVALSLGAVACGGDDGGDSKATKELIADLQAKGMKKKQAECIARAFEDAGLGPEEADAVGKGKVDDIDPDALEVYAKSATTCLGFPVSVPGS